MSAKNKLPVTIDVTAVVYGRGVSRYTSNLTRALISNPQVKVTVFGSNWGLWSMLKGFVNTLPDSTESSLWKFPPRLLYLLWQLTGRPQPVSEQGVFHAWDWQLPPWKHQPIVVSIYDLAYKIFPHTAHPKIKKRYDQLLAQVEQSPNIHVITTSEASKHDLLRLTNINPERVHMVYPGLPQEVKVIPSTDELATVKRKFNLHKPFLLFVGTTEPRKNLKNIITAWRQLADQYELVIVGAAGWDEYDVEEGMHVLGYVTSPELAALYRQAHALMYVSLYEGFGLPILEAYFHHCPVITGNLSSMPETAGSPGILVDPQDPTAIAEAVLSIEERDTKARAKREHDMDEVLQQFSWERAAQQTIEVYQIARNKK